MLIAKPHVKENLHDLDRMAYGERLGTIKLSIEYVLIEKLEQALPRIVGSKLSRFLSRYLSLMHDQGADLSQDGLEASVTVKCDEVIVSKELAALAAI